MNRKVKYKFISSLSENWLKKFKNGLSGRRIEFNEITIGDEANEADADSMNEIEMTILD